MNDKDARFNRRLAMLVLVSFIIFATAVVMRVGIGATSYDARDSAGRTMGFNDHLSAEHYAIILRNFNPKELLKPEYTYEWVLFAAHLVGAGLLIFPTYVGSRYIRWFFIAQPAVFPLGVPAILFLPLLVSGLITGPMDREGFIDIPFILAVSQPVWVIMSLTIAFGFRRTGQGLGANLEHAQTAPSAAPSG